MEGSYEKIAVEIERYIIKFGGINVSEALFKRQRKDFNSRFQRFMKTRTTSSIPNGKLDPEHPWGYLLGLCVKHFVKRNVSKDYEYSVERKMKELFELATAYVFTILILDLRNFPWKVHDK